MSKNVKFNEHLNNFCLFLGHVDILDEPCIGTYSKILENLHYYTLTNFEKFVNIMILTINLTILV